MRTSIVNATEYTARQARAAQRVLDALDRADKRLIAHYSQHRDHARKKYRGIVTVLVPPEEFKPEDAIDEPVRFDAFARNISCSGLAFIYPGELRIRNLIVGLSPSPPQINWFTAEVVRTQRAQEGFWDYGVELTGRTEL
ncbi:MAG TPA: PilZ domain-containing protein [Planctomycetaceae bacterium]|nr:PilZ domain-containing protein [Planctomycetaceae bacterium]